MAIKPNPMRGDRAAHDVSNFPSRHASDIENGTYIYHSPPAGKWVHDQYIATISGANLAAGDQGVKPLRLYAAVDATLEEVFVCVNTTPSAAALRVDVLLNGASIFDSVQYVEIGTGNNTASKTDDFDTGEFSKGDYFQIELVQGDTVAADLTVHIRFKYKAA
jgi:hypothetical protein